MLLANAGLLLGGLFWGWLGTIVGLDLTFHIATLAIMLSTPLCVIWSLDPIDRMWRLAMRVFLAKHLELQEKREHPLHRIMQVEEKPDSIVIKTTDIRLPRWIGEALRHAYKSSLELRYTAESYSIEVQWSREL